MLDRYTRPPMERIWSDRRKFETWLEVEIAALEGWAREGTVPRQAVEAVRDQAGVDVERIKEVEKVTRHDVAAFVQSIEETVGEEHGRWVHFGLTSSDILDTAFALRLREASDILLDDIGEMLDVLERRAHEFEMTPRVGRSHGIHAEPTTLGHTFALWYQEMKRARKRIEKARAEVAVGKISGSVGTFGNVPPEVEATACDELGLEPAAVSSQIIQRDRHAEFVSTLGVVASSLEKFGTEVRHLQRTEVGEAEEKFHEGQKGSSSMPHKRNPVLSENVTGQARTIRGYIGPALENVALWHERDISHSSVERTVAPDSTTLLDFALVRMTKVVDELVVYPDKMQENLEQQNGLIFSQRLLLALVRSGLARDDAYERVQSVALDAFENDLDFRQLVRDEESITSQLSEETIDRCFDLEDALRHIPDIFDRVFE